MLIATILRHLSKSKMLLMFVMVGLLYSCGGGDNGTPDTPDTPGDSNDTAMITPVADEFLGAFSFETSAYQVASGGTVDVIITLSGEKLTKEFPITLKRQINALDMPNEIVMFEAGRTEYIYTYDASDAVSGTVVQLTLEQVPENYQRNAAPAVINVEANSIQFGKADYTAQAGDNVDVEIEISAPLKADVAVPIKVTDTDGAETIKIITMPASQTSTTYTHTISSSSSVGVAELSFDSIPSGLDEGTNLVARIAVEANDAAEPVSINFAQNEYNVIAGQDLEIEVHLTSDLSLTGPIAFDYEYQAKGSSSATSATGTFASTPGGATSKTAKLIYNAGAVGSGHSYKIKSGTKITIDGTEYEIILGNPAETIINVVSNDISFKNTSSNIIHGKNVEYTVLLSSASSKKFGVPINIASVNADGSTETSSVLLGFLPGQQEKKAVFSTNDRQVASDVVLTFGNLGVSGYVALTGKDRRTVRLRGNAVSFSADTPTTADVELGDDYTVYLTLSHPQPTDVDIPLTVQIIGKDGTANRLSKVWQTMPASQTRTGMIIVLGDILSVGDEVHLKIDTAALASNGLSAGSDTGERVATIIANNAIEFNKTSYNINLGEAVDIPIKLQKARTTAMDVTVKREFRDLDGDIVAAETGENTVTFEVGSTEAIIKYDSALANIGTVTFTIDEDSLPDEVMLNAAKATLVVNIDDTRLNFTQAEYIVSPGDAFEATLRIGNVLSAQATIRLFITKTFPDGTVSDTETVTQIVSAGVDTVTVGSGNANAYKQDSDEAGTSIKYEIDETGLSGVVLGDITTSIVKVVDKPVVSFGATSYEVPEGDTSVIHLMLSRVPTQNVQVEVGYIHPDNPATFNRHTITFTPTHTPNSDGTLTEKITVSADYVATVKANGGDGTIGFWHGSDLETGAIPTTKVIVVGNNNNNVSFDSASYNVRATDLAKLKVNLATPAVGDVSIPIQVAIGEGSLPSDIGTLTIIDGETSGIFEYDTETSAEAVGTKLTFSFGTLPTGVTVTDEAIATTVVTITDSGIEFSVSSLSVHSGSNKDFKILLSSPATHDSLHSIWIHTVDETKATGIRKGLLGFAHIYVGETETSFSLTGSLNGGNHTVNFGKNLGAGFTHKVGGNKQIALTVLPNKVSFAEDSYSVSAGGSVDVTIQLTSARTKLANIPLLIDDGSGAAPVSAGSATMRPGQNSTTFTYNAPAIVSGSPPITGDYTLSFDTANWSHGLTAGDTDETTLEIRVNNNNVSFDSASYNVRATDLAKLQVNLATPAVGDVSIPIQVAIGEGSLPSDIGTLTITNGETSGTFEYNTKSSAEAIGTVLSFSFGTLPTGVTVTDEAIASTVVTITDSAIEFDISSLTLHARSQKDIKLLLSSPATRNVSQNIWLHSEDSTKILAGSVDIIKGKTDATLIFTAGADAGDYTLKFADDLGAGFTHKTDGNAEVAVTIQVNKVSFAKDSYRLLAGGSIDVTIQLTAKRGASATIPLLVDNGSGSVSAGSVTIPPGQNSAIFTYNAPVTQPNIFNPNPGYITGDYTLSFDTNNWSSGLTADDTDETTLEIIDYNISFVGDRIVPDGGYVDVPVILGTQPIETLVIPYTINNRTTAVETSSGTITFEPTDIAEDDGTIIKNIRINSSDIGALNSSQDIKFGTPLPAGVTVGTIADIHVVVSKTQVSFGSREYKFRPGLPLNITVKLNLATASALTIPITITNDDDDSSLGTVNAVFAVDTMETTFAHNGSLGSKISYSFDDSTLPSGIEQPAGITNVPAAYREASVETIDGGVSFQRDSYLALTNEPANVTVALHSKAETELTIPVLLDGVAYDSVTFGPDDVATYYGWVEKTIQVDSTNLASTGQSTMTFGALPTGVSLDTVTETIYTEALVEFAIRQISFNVATQDVRAGATAEMEFYTTHSSPKNFTIPINVSVDGGALTSAGEVVLLFSGWGTGSVSHDTTIAPDVVGDKFTYSFGTLPEGLAFADDGNKEIELTVTDSDIEFEKASQAAVAGSTVPVKIIFDSPATEDVYIVVQEKSNSNISYYATALEGNSETSFDYDIAADATGTYTLIFDTDYLGDGYTIKTGGNTEMQINIVENTNSVSFDTASYDVLTGSAVDVNLTLANAAVGEVTIPLNMLTSGSTDVVSQNVVFADGEKTKTFSYDASLIVGGTTITYNLGTLPVGVTAGAITESVVTVDNTVGLSSATYSVASGSDLVMTLNLAGAVEHDLDVVLTASPTSLAIADVTVSFIAGEASKTFTYTAATVTEDTDVTFSIKTLPTGVTAGTISESVVKISPPRGLSFVNATIPDVYINETVNIAVAVDVPFNADTVIPIIRSGTGTIPDIAVTFVAGETTANIVDTAPAGKDIKDHAMTYSFKTNNDALPAYTTVDTGKDRTQYTVKGYEYQFTNQAASGYDQIVSGATGKVIYAPLLLDAPLKAKIDILFGVQNLADGNDSWSEGDITNFGTVGTAEQFISYSLPDTSDNDYVVRFWIVDVAGQKGIKVTPTLATGDEYYDVQVVSSNVISFDKATDTVAPGTSIDIKVKLSNPTSDALSIPLNVDDGTGAVLAGTIDFTGNSYEATFSYSNITAGDYSFSFGRLPSEIIEGILNESTLTIAQP